MCHLVLVLTSTEWFDLTDPTKEEVVRGEQEGTYFAATDEYFEGLVKITLINSLRKLCSFKRTQF